MRSLSCHGRALLFAVALSSHGGEPTFLPVSHHVLRGQQNHEAPASSSSLAEHDPHPSHPAPAVAEHDPRPSHPAVAEHDLRSLAPRSSRAPPSPVATHNTAPTSHRFKSPTQSLIQHSTQSSEVFAHVPKDEVKNRIENMKEVTSQKLTKLDEEKQFVVAQMAELKKILYGKFKDSINLEEDSSLLLVHMSFLG
ncbi:hypothetical protein Ahy_B01g054383 [Arachis hypogaea]|uniref:Uncharacterized protein n=1 Tax=Arachis hypogaea TaxID=3818 RepID=A0A445ATR8_ARAHY|nr:hypothetical protein Ahy_B01g054383 [Arachis hypogaea]